MREDAISTTDIFREIIVDPSLIYSECIECRSRIRYGHWVYLAGIGALIFRKEILENPDSLCSTT
jgi:hypothetical protein